MHDKEIQFANIEVPEDILSRWQDIADILANVLGVPAALIMRVVHADIEVFVSSKTTGNPYTAGSRERLLGSGLYCETVISAKSKLLVPNALADERWKDNPDVKLNMISYLGFPIRMPDGTVFGTICVLDSKENAYAPAFEQLIEQFRYIVEAHLELLHMNTVLGDKNRKLQDYIDEIRVLRGVLPVCAICKKIRDENGKWHQIERYITDRSEARFSHAFCPDCAAKWREEQGLA
ncbi:MAG: GAF domain-containing protein [Chitinivibrionales bacterium]|nr:GAF domain-containing protein [Chitinivibrionales bacterium]MBD3394250.1 GAF domain-containing protein [Chitinivibrionales bacterium]